MSKYHFCNLYQYHACLEVIFSSTICNIVKNNSNFKQRKIKINLNLKVKKKILWPWLSVSYNTCESYLDSKHKWNSIYRNFVYLFETWITIILLLNLFLPRLIFFSTLCSQPFFFLFLFMTWIIFMFVYNISAYVCAQVSCFYFKKCLFCHVPYHS